MSEAGEYYSYLDPQDLGPPIPDPDYPIREEEEVEHFLLYTPAHPTFQSLPPPSLLYNQTQAGPSSSSGSGVTTAVQAAINAAIAALPQAQNTGKNYKLPDQANFFGCTEHIESFLLECTMRFKVLPDDFNTTNKKVFYALLLMKEGVAQTWKEQYLHAHENKCYLVDKNSWTSFVNALKASFADPGNQMNTMRLLKTIQQNNGSINNLNTQFRLLILKTGLDMIQNAALLIQMYEDAISPRLFQTLVVNGKNLDNVKTYIMNASIVDRAFQ